MNTLKKLNKSIDDTIYMPHYLPVYEYIQMPNISSCFFENFREKYFKYHGENLEEFNEKLDCSTIYAVFKNKNNNPPFYFEPINGNKSIKS